MNYDEFLIKLKSITDPESFSVIFNITSFFEGIKDLLNAFTKEKNLSVIYISSTIPSKNIISLLEVYGLDLNNIYFVDTISSIMMASEYNNPNILYVESPTMLETIMIKTEYIMEKYIKGDVAIIIDSINTLAVHNDTKILSEFFHLFATLIRSKNAFFIILSIRDQNTQEIKNIMSIVSDEIIEVD
ncbi:MAG: hypothetical protein ACP5RZ_00735 [Thermoplasmata archaeon]|mgnify:CR=1 FL=1